MLDKAAILAAAELPRATIEVPELKGKVTVRCLTGSEREALFNLFVDAKEGHVPKHYRATLCTYGIIDPTSGKRLFPDEAVGEVGALPFDALRSIAAEIERLSGLSVSAEEAAGN